jgi:transcriptional regulator with XRE-family HTH domain
MEELVIRIGRLVKEKRIEKEYSTQELAEKLDISAGLINNIERGKTDTFNLNLMGRLCSTLGIEILSLLADKTDDISRLLNISQEIPENLSNQINILTEEYIKAAIKLNFNDKKLETMLYKLVYEVNFLSEIEK